MFLYFIFVLLAIIAIVVTVKLLHNNQQRALQERANEDLSLPPVDPDSIPEREGLEWEDEAPVTSAAPQSAHDVPTAPVTETETQPEPEPETEENLAHEPQTETTEVAFETEAVTIAAPEPKEIQKTESAPESELDATTESVPEFKLEPTPDPLQTNETASPSPTQSSTEENSEAIDWKDQVQALKNADQFDDALRACQAGWPQWQSYQQAAIVCRAAVRQPDLPEEEVESWLQALYLLATHASFLHDKVPGMENLGWQRLEKTLSVEDLRDLQSNWQEMGYKAFRLLNKTDCRLLVKAWGEPDNHQSAKLYYKKHFMSITSS